MKVKEKVKKSKKFDEKEFVEKYKNATQQERDQLMIKLKEKGFHKSDVAWLKNSYDKYLTITSDI